MKLKKLIPLLLLLLLPMQTLTSQTSKTNSGSSEKTAKEDFGLQDRSYTKDEVVELLTIMSEEADTAIESSYAEGYKAGVLEYKPENARLQTLNEEIKKESEEMQKKYSSSVPKWKAVAFCVGTGAAAFSLGYILQAVVTKLR